MACFQKPFLFAATLLASPLLHGMDAPKGPRASMDERHRTFLKEYCQECHDAEKHKGKVRLDDLTFTLDTVERADLWQKILGQLNAREMPPEDARQPSEHAKAEFLDALSQTLVLARKTLGDEGREGVLRRLNKREYILTMRELFGIETEAEGLPDDKGTGVFDTMGSALFMSSNQLERYLAVARSVVSAAITELRTAATPPERKTVRTEPETASLKHWSGIIHAGQETFMQLRKWKQSGQKADNLPKGFTTVEAAKAALNGPSEWNYHYAARMLAMPLATEGSYLTLNYYWNINPQITLPTDAPPGTYTLRVRAATADQPALPRFLELLYLEGGDRYKPRTVEVRDLRAPLAKPELVEFSVRVTPDSPRFYQIREKQFSDKEADHQKHLAELFSGNGIGIRPAVWVDWTEWEGPQPDPDLSRRREILLGPENADAEDPATARAVLERFATRAFRGVAPKPSFLDKLLTLQQARRQAGEDFPGSLVEPMAVVLASPRFLYLNEPPPAPNPPQGSVPPASNTAPPQADRRLTDLELASRLSYLLWAGPPDDALIAEARAGTLRQADRLAAQVDRLIAHPRSLNFATGFAHQWLQVDRLDLFQFDYRNFPKFDESTRVAARGEVYRTFHTLLTENLDARKLLHSDFIVINSVLADYYGIPLDDKKRPITGVHFRKVPVPPDSPRGGLLGMACILAMGSNGSTTSPVERGAWVLRKLLNDPPPPAPANVPQLARLADKKLNARERLTSHQEQAQCMQCHRRIDPIGFGLENFDAGGLWREADTFKPGELLRRNAEGKLLNATYPIDPSGAFHRGEAFENFFQLRERIAARGDAFLRGLQENLLEYALGRKVSFLDEDTLDALLAAAQKEGGGLRDIVQRLVATEAFQLR